jgi:diguanylate cyclase (GGDEF)-like protein
MMGNPVDFFKAIVDSMVDHIAVIDESGTIRYVNAAWVNFGTNNACTIHNSHWLNINYLDICDQSATLGEPFGMHAAEGIRKVIRQELDLFYFEYPCHSFEEERWFMMKVTPLCWQGAGHYVISHHNITERKQAEEQMRQISLLDGLTGVANRRHFDEFLLREWRTCECLELPVSMVILDVDHFKLYNDHYGHLEGDECLRQICRALMPFVEKPGGLLARYGGEEFALILGRTDAEEATQTAYTVLNAIGSLGITHAHSPVMPLITASVGVATVLPGPDTNPHMLIEAADRRLYQAKQQGKNQVRGGVF